MIMSFSNGTVSRVVLGQLILPLSLLSFAANANANADQATYFIKKYEVKHARGFKHSKNSASFLAAAPKASFTSSAASVPSQYSLRGKAGPVEDQGQCGSCWDFSLTSVLRGTWITSGKDPGRLSFNYLLNCASTEEGCNGGDFTAADYFISPKGAPAYGSDGKYTQEDGTCQPMPAMASTVSYHMLGVDGTNASFQDIAYVVGVLHRPVSIDIAADDTFEDYSSGVYNGCSDENAGDINHMVAIEGYDCQTSVDSNGNCVFDANGNLPNGVGLWIVRNSWGTTWGDNGYITMKATDSKGQRCNAVATDALYYDLTDAQLGLRAAK
jgi:C1A family cysteine protease